MTAVGALPPITRDLDQALADLKSHGLCLIAGVLDDAMLNRAREALYRAAADDRARNRERKGFALDQNDHNQRVWNLLNRDSVFTDLAEHPVALKLVRETLGWPVLLSNISGNIAEPGAVRGVLHPDQIFVPEPWPREPQGLNVAWCIDAFTETNGATEIAPGSHRLHRKPTEAEQQMNTVPLVAPAGTLCAFESRVWHRSGANTSTNETRAAVFPFYTTTIYRPQENWFLSLDPGVARYASETLLTLLAYKSEGFGLVYGESPR